MRDRTFSARRDQMAAGRKAASRDSQQKIIDAKNAADRIASTLLGISTLASRHCDSLDFHEVACWNLQAALVEAYLAGLAGTKVDPSARAEKGEE